MYQSLRNDAALAWRGALGGALGLTLALTVSASLAALEALGAGTGFPFSVEHEKSVVGVLD